MVFETLELLSKQKRPKGDGAKEKGLHLVMDDPVVVLDSSILGERGNIDLKQDEKEIQRRITMTVFISFSLNLQNNSRQYSILRLYDSSMGVISSNLTSDNKDRSFLLTYVLVMISSLSRCSISPEGQFTIGNVNNTSVLHGSVDTRPSTTLEEKSSISTVVGESSSEVSLHSPELVTESSKPSVSEAGSEQESKSESEAGAEQLEPISDGELPEMDIPDQASPIASRNSNQTSDHRKDRSHDLWRLEDPYDASGNHPQPYVRGKVLLDKKDVKKKNELNWAKNQLAGPVDYSNPEDLFFCVSPSELEVFR